MAGQYEDEGGESKTVGNSNLLSLFVIINLLSLQQTITKIGCEVKFLMYLSYFYFFPLNDSTCH